MEFQRLLTGKTAVVTGASRGIGRGVASVLADSGATVYASGRTVMQADLPAAVIRLSCDHTVDDQVAQLFERVRGERGQLDVLANCVWGGYDRLVEDGQFTWPRPFWEQPLWRWEAMFDAGVRAGFVASQHAARLMVPRASGLIAHLSHWAAQKHIGNAIYGISKAATDKMTADMSHELAGHGIAVVSLYPGLVRTESVMQYAAAFDLTNSESPEFAGRAIAALASDPEVMRLTGQAVTVARLALDYGFTDIDGRQPWELTLADA